jgi:hypothetical protein
MMSSIIERCAAVLSAAPDSVLPLQRIGTRRPAGSGDIPFLVLSLQVNSAGPGTLGREVRLDEQLRTRRGDVYSGLLQFDAWATSSDAVLTLTEGIERRLSSATEPLRAEGFTRLQPASLDAAEQSRHEPAVGTPFAVWRQRLAYHFTCEVEPVEQETEGEPIQRIDVVMADVEEPFSVPA